MDLSALLPILLLSKNRKPDELTSALLGSMSRGKRPSASDLMGTLFRSNGGSPEMAAVLNAALSKAAETKNPQGLVPVMGFINDDLLGKLTRFFTSPAPARPTRKSRAETNSTA